jgi:hypothetical protein
MRWRTVQQLQPLVRQAKDRCQSQCSGRCYATESCADTAARRSSTAPAQPAAAAARADSGRHATTSSSHLSGFTSSRPSSRAFAATAGSMPSRTLAGHPAATFLATGPARWGAALRPFAATAVSQPWPLGRQHTPYNDGGSARGFASQPIGRITPEGFTEKAWEVWQQHVDADVAIRPGSA